MDNSDCQYSFDSIATYLDYLSCLVVEIFSHFYGDTTQIMLVLSVAIPRSTVADIAGSHARALLYPACCSYIHVECVVALL